MPIHTLTRGSRKYSINDYSAATPVSLVTPASYNVLAWWMVDDLALNNGNQIGTWGDHTGGYTATSGNGPIYTTNYIGTRPAAVFGSSKDLTLTPGVNLTAGGLAGGVWTVAVVLRNTSDGNVMGSTLGNYQMRHLYPAGAMSMYNGSSYGTSNALATTAGNPMIAWYIHTATNAVFYENQTNRGGNAWSTYGGLMNYMGRTSYGGNLPGGISEFCVWTQDMSQYILKLYTEYFLIRYGNVFST